MKDAIQKGASDANIESYITDIARSWPILLISSVTALIFGYLYLWIIRLVGGVLIWISIAVIEIALIAGGFYTWWYRGRKYTPEDEVFKYMTWGAYVLWGLGVLVFFLVCCFWHAIKIGIAVFKTTSQYV